MKRLWLVVFFWCCLFSVRSQPAVVHGIVRDKSDGQALPGTGVIYAKNKGIAADEHGFYELMLQPGRYTLLFRMIGYQPETRHVEVQSGDSLSLDVWLVQQAVEMDQVVVTASRIEQRIAELSVSMSVIDAHQVERQQPVSAQELITRAPGIEVLDGQASIRGGSGFSYGAGSRVLALVDGLPIIAADAGNIRWQFLPLDNIKQVEIIKGASSVVYGSSALNGVINFRTADATTTPVTKAYAELGIYDRPRNKDWVWWNKPPVLGTIGFHQLRKQKHTDIGFGMNFLGNSGYRQRNEENLARMHLKLKRYDPKIKGLIYGMNFNGGFTRKTDFVLWENAQTGALIQDTSTAILLQASFLALDPFISYHKTNQIRHDLRMRLQRSDNQFPGSTQNDSEALSLYAEYQFSSPLTDWAHLSSGFSVHTAYIRSKFYGDHRNLNPGAFAQVELSPNQALKLVAGMRAEAQRQDGIYEKLIPLFRAGLNYKLFELSYLRASFGQGYRFPSIAERHAATTLGAVQIFPNQKLLPEKGWNAEIGWKQGLKWHQLTAQFDIAVFYAEHRQMIEYIFSIYRNPVTDKFSPGFKADNIEAARIYGVETEWIIQWETGKLKHNLRGGYVFMEPKEINELTGKATGEMLKYRRKHAASLHYMLQINQFDIGLDSYYRSKMLRIDDVFLSPLTREAILPGFYTYWMENNHAYLLLDLRLAMQLTPLFQLSLMVKNIGNTEYMGRPGDIQPQRSYLIRASFTL